MFACLEWVPIYRRMKAQRAEQKILRCETEREQCQEEETALCNELRKVAVAYQFHKSNNNHRGLGDANRRGAEIKKRIQDLRIEIRGYDEALVLMRRRSARAHKNATRRRGGATYFLQEATRAAEQQIETEAEGSDKTALLEAYATATSLRQELDAQHAGGTEGDVTSRVIDELDQSAGAGQLGEDPDWLTFLGDAAPSTAAAEPAPPGPRTPAAPPTTEDDAEFDRRLDQFAEM